MPISEEQYYEIRKCERNGMSQRNCAIKLGMSRNTVAKYWGGNNTPVKYDKNINMKSCSKGNFSEELTKIIEDICKNFENDVTQKQKLTARTVYDNVKQVMSVGYSTVKRYFSEIQNNKKETFVKILYSPGQVMQVDWTELTVKIGSLEEKIKVYVFCAVLCYSKKIFAVPFLSTNFRSLALAHAEAFRYFGGICKEIWYDNMSTAVAKETGNKAIKTKNFQKMEIHYGFEAKFMNKARGNEKGVVENLCGTIKTRIITGIPKIKDILELSNYMLNKCNEYNNTHKIVSKPLPIKEMFEKEKMALRSIPLRDYCENLEKLNVKVSKDLFFKYNQNSYSAAEKVANENITIIEGIHEIQAWFKGEQVAKHVISHGKGKIVVDYRHFLDLLLIKKRARGYALPVVEGALPEALEAFRNFLIDHKKDLAELGNTMVLIRLYNIEDESIFLNAVQKAVNTGKPSYNKIKQNLLNVLPTNVDLTSDDFSVDYNNYVMYDDLVVDIKPNTDNDDDDDNDDNNDDDDNEENNDE
jgi:predicted transcriptional regulator